MSAKLAGGRSAECDFNKARYFNALRPDQIAAAGLAHSLCRGQGALTLEGRRTELAGVCAWDAAPNVDHANLGHGGHQHVILRAPTNYCRSQPRLRIPKAVMKVDENPDGESVPSGSYCIVNIIDLIPTQ